MMPSKNHQEYLKTRVMTASPEQLHLMLYDGAIRFADQARLALQEKRFEESFNLITKVEKIVMEMNSGLKDDVEPEVCKKMRALYLYCYDRLIAANIKHRIEPLDEAMKILRHMRETWVMLMEKLQDERARQQSSSPVYDSGPNPDSQSEEVGSLVNFQG